MKRRVRVETRGQHEHLGQLVALTYSDPWVEASGGFSFSDENDRVCLNSCVGWLIEWAEDLARVASEHTDDGQWRWVTTVPRHAIVKLSRLEPAKEEPDASPDPTAATPARASRREAPRRGQARTPASRATR